MGPGHRRPARGPACSPATRCRDPDRHSRDRGGGDQTLSMDTPIRVLMITAGWPQPGQPQTTHFVKRQAEFLQRAGVDVDVFHFRGAKRLWNYVRAWRDVRPRINANRVDLVHAQFGQSGILALPKRLPLVVTLRGSDIL